MSDSEIGCFSVVSMVSCTATGAPIWAVAEAGVWFFTPALLGFLRVFELTAHGNRTTQVCDSSICGICQPLHSWLDSLCSIRAQNAPSLVGSDHRQRPRGARME